MFSHMSITRATAFVLTFGSLVACADEGRDNADTRESGGGKTDDANDVGEAASERAEELAAELVERGIQDYGGPSAADILATDPEYAHHAYDIDKPLGKFCAKPSHGFDAVAPGYNSDNVETLAWAASNVYAHFANFANSLRDAGWATPADAQLWNKRGLALALVSLAETWQRAGGVDAQGKVALPEYFNGNGGAAAQAAFEQHVQEFGVPWFTEIAEEMLRQLEAGEERYGARDGAGLRELWLRTPQAGLQLQFFTAGRMELGASGPTFIEESTQFAWVRHPDKNVLLLVFRGTEPHKFEDILVDLQALRNTVSIEGTDYKIHGGFNRAFDSVKDTIKAKLELDGARDGQPASVWLTGHSLGGALAVLSTGALEVWKREADPAADNINIGGLYTFGGPRVGDSAFARWVDEAARDTPFASLRFRRADDPVTKLGPMRFGMIEFSHASQMVLYNPGAVPFEDVATLAPDQQIAFLSTAEPGKWSNNQMTAEDFLPEYLIDKEQVFDIGMSLGGCISPSGRFENVTKCRQMHDMGPDDGASYYSQARRQAESNPVQACESTPF